MDKTKLLAMLTAMGWREESKTGKLIRLESIPLIKEDSALNFNEDFANILEIYLHGPQELKKKNENLYKLIETTLCPRNLKKTTSSKEIVQETRD